MYFTVEEENLICLYHNADRRRTAANLRAALPDMDKEMVALACQTRRDNPLKGTWELVGLVNTATGRVEPPAVRQLKFVGNRSFFTMVFFNDSVPDTSILFQGSGGSFEYVSDTVVRERSLDCPVRRIGPDRYRMTWRDLNSNEQFTEEWRRIETPPQLEKYWEIVQ